MSRNSSSGSDPVSDRTMSRSARPPSPSSPSAASPTPSSMDRRSALFCSTGSLCNTPPRRARTRRIISGEIASGADSGPASWRSLFRAAALTLRRMAGIISGGIVRFPGKIHASLPGGNVLREDHPPEIVLPVGGGGLLTRGEDPSRENLLVVVRIEPDPPHPLALQDLVELPSLFSHAEPLEREEEREEFLRCDLAGEVEGGDLLQEELGGEGADEAVAVAEEHVPVKDLVLGDAEQKVAGRLLGNDVREVPVELLHAPREGRVPRLVHGDPVERQGHFHREPFDPADIRPLCRALHRPPGSSRIREIVSAGRGRMFNIIRGRGTDGPGRFPVGKRVPGGAPGGSDTALPGGSNESACCSRGRVVP